MLSQTNIPVQIVDEIRHCLPDIDRLTVPIDLSYLASCLGYRIEEARIKQQGYITETPEGEHLIRVRTDDPPKVKRFTIAHEIGHVLLNMCEDKPFNRAVKFRLCSNSREERMADRIASEILMPAARFEADLSRYVTPSFSSLGAMAGIFGVSLITCLRRITELPRFIAFSYLYELLKVSDSELEVSLQTQYSSSQNLMFVENPFVIVRNCYSYSLTKGRDWEGKIKMIANDHITMPVFCNLYNRGGKSLARLSGWKRNDG